MELVVFLICFVLFVWMVQLVSACCEACPFDHLVPDQAGFQIVHVSLKEFAWIHFGIPIVRYSRRFKDFVNRRFPTLGEAYFVVFDPFSEHSERIHDIIDEATVSHVSLFCYHIRQDSQ